MRVKKRFGAPPAPPPCSRKPAIRLFEWRWKAYQPEMRTDLGIRYEYCPVSVAITVDYALSQSCLLSICYLYQSITQASTEGSTHWLYPTLFFSNSTFTRTLTNAHAGRFKDGRIYWWTSQVSRMKTWADNLLLQLPENDTRPRELLIITSLLSETEVCTFDLSDHREPWSSGYSLARVLEKIGPILGRVRWNIAFLKCVFC